MRAGASDFRTKPISTAELVDTLRRSAEAAGSGAPDPLDRAERDHILKMLDACNGNISEAARRLKLHRRTLQRKLQKLPSAG
jgi:two-component system response regulator RegA